MFPVASRLVRLGARAAILRNQQTADPQGGIANHLGVHAVATLARVQLIAGIDLVQFFVRNGRLLVRAGRHEQPHDVFHVPVVLDKLRRQPVEQLGVRRRLALPPEVIEPRRQAGAEEKLPHPVDVNA